MVAIVHEQDVVCRDDGRINGTSHVHFGEHIFIAIVRKDDDVTIFVSKIDLVVNDESRAPDSGKRIVNPVGRAGIGIEAVQETAEVGDIDQAIGDGSGRN